MNTGAHVRQQRVDIRRIYRINKYPDGSGPVMPLVVPHASGADFAGNFTSLFLSLVGAGRV